MVILKEENNKLRLEISKLKESSQQVVILKEENNRLRLEIEHLRKEIVSIETNIKNVYETKISGMKNEYDQHITSIVNKGNTEAEIEAERDLFETLGPDGEGG